MNTNTTTTTNRQSDNENTTYLEEMTESEMQAVWGAGEGTIMYDSDGREYTIAYDSLGEAYKLHVRALDHTEVW